MVEKSQKSGGVRRRETKFPQGISTSLTTINGSSTYFQTTIATDQKSSFKEKTETPAYTTGWLTRERLLHDPDVNPEHKELLRRQDYGQPFLNEKTTVSTPIVAAYRKYSDVISYGYRGPVFADTSFESHLTITPLNDDLIRAAGDGAKAIKATAPTRSEASLSQMIGEMREGLPKMMGAKFLTQTYDIKSGIRNSSDEFLNYQFGINPLVRDLDSLLKSVLKTRKIMEQVYRDNDRSVRRKLRLPDEVTATSAVLPNRSIWPQPNSRLVKGPTLGNMSIDVVETTSKWFSGSFHYSVPNGDTFFERLELYEMEARKTLGLSLTPEVFYDLSPYSWLIDWFMDIGTLLSNMTLLARDQLAIERAYYMFHRVNQVSLRHLDTTLYGVPDISTSLTFERKMRVKASPYGIGIEDSGLTAIQLAILAALGISKSPKALLG